MTTTRELGFRVQQFRGRPTRAVGTTGRGRSRCTSSVRETSATIVGDEDIFLHQSKCRHSKTGVGIVLLLDYRERGPSYEGTEDHVRRPLTATGLNQLTPK